MQGCQLIDLSLINTHSRGARYGARATLQRLQARFDLPAVSFQERRQRELLAQLRQRLIRREARTAARDLEQDAVRLPKVEAPEVEAVNGPAEGQPQVPQPLRPGLVVAIGDTERNVVHAACAWLNYREVGLDCHVELSGGAALAHVVDVGARALVSRGGVFPDLPHAERAGEHEI